MNIVQKLVKARALRPGDLLFAIFDPKEPTKHYTGSPSSDGGPTPAMACWPTCIIKDVTLDDTSAYASVSVVDLEQTTYIGDRARTGIERKILETQLCRVIRNTKWQETERD